MEVVHERIVHLKAMVDLLFNPPEHDYEDWHLLEPYPRRINS